MRAMKEMKAVLGVEPIPATAGRGRERVR